MTIKGQRLCRMPCQVQRGRSKQPRPSATERGYGTEHQRLREAAKAVWQDGDPCARCEGPMRYGTPVDLDHTDDRSGYLGLSHASCSGECRKAANRTNMRLQYRRKVGIADDAPLYSRAS